MTSFIILSIFAIINIISFVLMALDKYFAIRKRWRISEMTLLLISALGGSLGTVIGMIVCRHKTSKAKFRYGVPVLILLQWGSCLWMANAGVIEVSIQLVR